MRAVLWVIVCGCALLGCTSAYPPSRADDAGTVLDFYNATFERLRKTGMPLVRWAGDEHFCIIWNDPDTRLRRFVPRVIADLSRVYALDFSVSEVATHHECPSTQTDFYVWIGKNPGKAGFAEILEDLSGSRPPMSFLERLPDTRPARTFVSTDSALGLSMLLPGSRPREFLFVDSQPPDHLRHLVDLEAIFLEELMHALLRAGDVLAERSISMMAEVIPDGGYAEWYTRNARGWCAVDFVFLELAFGESAETSKGFYSARRHLQRNFTDLNRRAARRRSALRHLSDSRC